MVIMMEQNKILIRIPKETKKELQIIAIKKETTMTKIIQDLIQEYIQQNRKT